MAFLLLISIVISTKSPLYNLIVSLINLMLISFIYKYFDSLPEFLLNLQLFSPNNYDQLYPLCSLLYVLPVGVKFYENADTQKLSIIADNKGKTGIYQWTHKGSNLKYIGSSVDLGKRLYNYFLLSYLVNHCKNSYIYNALLKDGHSAFNLTILEYIDISNLSNENSKKLILEREQFYLDKIKPKYNILSTAGNSLGYKHSEEKLFKRVKKRKIS